VRNKARPEGMLSRVSFFIFCCASEAKIGDPVCYRSMYFVERYLGELKSTVRNKARPEGCIAESILAKEAMALCSGFIDCFESLLNNVSRNDDYDETLGCDTSQASTLFPYAGTALGKPRSYVIRGLMLNKSRLCIMAVERAIEMSRKYKMRSSIYGLEAILCRSRGKMALMV